MVSSIKKGENEWHIYVEGNTSPSLNGTSTILGETNNDAGTATDRDNKGHLQISELHYSLPFQNERFSAGLISLAGTLDASNIASDETTQFLSTSLVNNPTIEFPDYAIGAVINYESGSGVGLTVLISSSHGLSDNPNKSYSELVDLNAPGKGMFFATELHFHQWDIDIRTGIWSNTSDHNYLDGAGKKKSNSGFYMSIDGPIANGQWNTRLWIADKEVSQGEQFISFAFEYPFLSTTLGIGVTETYISNKGKTTQQDNIKQAEIYFHYNINNQLQISPSLQLLNNSNFDNSNSTFNNNQIIYSLRLGSVDLSDIRLALRLWSLRGNKMTAAIS
jgi:hypothetical protein